MQDCYQYIGDMRKITKILLCLIFVFALLVRFWKLGTYPDAIDEDEMAAGYYGYSLLRNGTDEYGHKFPIYFESVGDYKYGLLFYLETIPIGLFGLNPVSTRSVSAIAGSLSVVVIFFLAYEIFRKEKYALMAAFILAINPTNIHFSRVAYSNILGALFAILSITLFIQWIKGGRFWRAALALISLLLSIYTYQAYRIFLPLTFVSLIIIYWTSFKKKQAGVILFAFFTILIVGISFISNASRARSQSLLQLVNMPSLVEQLSEDGISGSSITVSRAFHNKIISFAMGMSGRYFEYFAPKFLFSEISAESGRFTTPGVGLVYLVDAILLLVGLIYLGRKVKGKEKFIPLLMIFCAPVAAATVIGPPNITRAVILVYGTSLLTALGAYVLVFSSRKTSILIGLILGTLYCANFVYFIHQYTIHKVYHHPWNSDVGLREMVREVGELGSDYQNVVIQGGHYMPFLFYNKITPRDFISKSVFNDFAQANGARVKNYGKIIFNMPECPPAGKRDTLYVCFNYKVPKFARLVNVIRYKDGQPAIILVEFGSEASSFDLPERLEYSSEVDKRFPDGVLPDNYESLWPVK
jgi:4-amino-4-deoxy-L-arabinose transferase-like glycosyltransferase